MNAKYDVEWIRSPRVDLDICMENEVLTHFYIPVTTVYMYENWITKNIRILCNNRVCTNINY